MAGKDAMPGERDEEAGCGAREGSCPVFGVRSGIAPIGLGLLLILFAVVTLLMHGISEVYLPAAVIFTGFGLFLVWMGIARKQEI